ncbi:HTH-type transcriptional regulator/antitoxin HipB [Humibacillus xanthopallidus]|uniref:HTH-type transcriptional regulator/antitoxin HipB n=1 Tax=Humibacillus xanthopallidus TaxID=412689 RepID=A0A543PT81_9MICO|nr:HTH-type transcriptional regulator/antitoxin HipB [Humibacillus xanthopallidus]
MASGMLGPTTGEAAVDDDLDVARLVMRVRRMADLSQRDLAARLGTSPSTVARIETGGCAVSVSLLRRILGLAGLRLVAVAPDGQPVAPVAGDTLRDNGGRRFPSHLDVDLPSEVPKLRQLMPRRDRPPAKGWYRQRPLRDERREQDGVPPDHPTFDDLREAAQRERAHLRRVRALLARAAPTPPECTCEIDCLMSPGCLPACACQCEPRRPRDHQRE